MHKRYTTVWPKSYRCYIELEMRHKQKIMCNFTYMKFKSRQN